MPSSHKAKAGKHQASRQQDSSIPDSEPARLSLAQLEAHLWGAADLLRGKVDAADYRQYICSLLFFKRLSDVWAEEHGDLAADGSAGPFRFEIPKGASWQEVSSRKKGVGKRLAAALKAIEAANPRLRGVIDDVGFDNSQRFADETLRELLRHFEKYRLGNRDVEPDILGNAYEYLIKKFADDAGKKGGEFYTPKQVVRLLVECVRPEEGMSIYDPACGSGGMLLEAVHSLERRDPTARPLRLFGQEMNLSTWSLCQMNLLLHGVGDADVARGDTLQEPAHLQDDGRKLRQFDRVLANPPFSLKKWGYQQWQEGDPYGRDTFGCPPRSFAELAFVQHMLASLKEDGILGVVVPHGVLFRKSERKIRRGMLEADLVEAVIALAPNLFYGTGIPACIWMLRRRKPTQRRGKVLFIDGSTEVDGQTAQNRLVDDNIERLAACYHAFVPEPGFAAVVSVDQIAAEGHDLLVSRWVRRPARSQPIDLELESRRLQLLERAEQLSRKQLWTTLHSLGILGEADPREALVEAMDGAEVEAALELLDERLGDGEILDLGDFERLGEDRALDPNAEGGRPGRPPAGEERS